jgi:hypothetical protein
MIFKKGKAKQEKTMKCQKDNEELRRRKGK